jgi:hypothetical protein
LFVIFAQVPTTAENADVGGLPVVGVDPGERFIMGTSEGRGMTKAEYHDHVKRQAKHGSPKTDREKYLARLARKKAVHDIESTAYSAASFKCGVDLGALLHACRVFQAHDKQIADVKGTRIAASERLRANSRLQRKFHNLLTSCFPDPGAVVVLGNGYRGRPTPKGQKYANVCMGLRRMLAQQRRVVLVNEFRTTITCSNCDALLTWPKASGTPPVEGRKQTCPGCDAEVERDLNAAKNMARLWPAWIGDRSRPGRLAFPSSQAPRA